MDENKKFFILNVANLLYKYYPAKEDVRHFIACQFALESNYGSSDFAQRFFNYCGMKKAYLRPNSQLSTSVTGFASYESLDKCLFDYALWLSWNKFRTDYYLDKFIIELRDSGYCPERDYINKIKSIYTQFKLNYHEK